ncbi:MAG: FAD-dependent oxidoreductase [candidate division KSB1 bacterium]|nr:FAD-dependent oxidoreductase [candidate division KSB1 bacterium]
MTAAVRGSLFRGKSPFATLAGSFLYPRLGIGGLAESLAAHAQATELVDIRVNSLVVQLGFDDQGKSWRVWYQRAGRTEVVTGQRIVSIIPVTSLLAMLPNREATQGLLQSLNYRGIICVMIEIDGPPVSSDTWTYFPDSHVLFGRMHEPRNWSPHMVPAGKTSLCLEIFCSEGDPVWQTPDTEIARRALSDLEALDLFDTGRVESIHFVRVPHAYPVYRKGYCELVKSARQAIAKWPGLSILGRTGTFTYMNMDAVMAQALSLARQLATAPDVPYYRS